MIRTVIFFIVLIFSSCVEEVELNFDHEPKLCLNCILNPDSLIKASVTLSHSLDNSAQFESVNNANIKLYENDILKGELTFISSGLYLLKQKPESGKDYKIIVEAQGYETLEAFTKVPEKPIISYSKDTGADLYWIYQTWIVNGVKYGGSSQAINAPFVDPFNRIIDTEEKYGFRFFLQVRMTDEGYDGQKLTFTIPDIVEKERTQHFLNADEHYDKYIKTTIIKRMNETDELPFYEPIQIYSNIENGNGIFGSCAITTINL